ncbi:alpha/beta hydrolase [Euzebya tangerina]|uniref:alpha/beta hydrolase n=1 Tax=Euzebya tangerina TaxID=591198 RepID=UPI0013C3552E|nr:alpha/beta hydrolase [Euzebya tangerina]
MIAVRFTLVHSPLVGPGTWTPVAMTLRDEGHDVAVPSLVRLAAQGRWEAMADSAAARAAEGDGPHVLVGHSGAGPLLPQIVSRMRPGPDALILVDAVIPPASGTVDVVPPQFFDFVRSLVPAAQEGSSSAGDDVARLPVWAEWFGDDAMVGLVVDPEVRARLRQEMPQLPLSYFAQPIPIPAGWDGRSCGYLLLSDAYGANLDAAVSRGWTVAVEPGNHLDMVNRRASIAATLVEMAGALLG